MDNFSNLMNSLAVAVVFVAIGVGVVKGIFHVLTVNKEKRNAVSASFEHVVAQLSSDNPSSRLSAAILLRRYLNVFVSRVVGGKNYYLKEETLNVMSSVLRVAPASVFQKTVADGLAYAPDISGIDLQRTNLQDVYLGNKSHTVVMVGADLFRADLSYALLDDVNATNACFYHAILFNARLKNADFSGADFRCADMSGCKFVNCRLENADFRGAFNLPDEIRGALENGFYKDKDKDALTTASEADKSTIFFSMPGAMTKREELIVREYETALRKRGYNVERYTRDVYPQFGQLGRVRHSIRKCCGLIAFGFRQIGITSGVYRPGTIDEQVWENRWLSTPWNELEVGMGLMAGLPVLLVHDAEVDFGVFDKMLSEYFVTVVDSSVDSMHLETNSGFVNWLSQMPKP